MIKEGVYLFFKLIGHNSISQEEAIDKLINKILVLINDKLNDRLSCKFSDTKIHPTTFEMDGSKGPRPYGFSRSLFQTFWDIVGEEVVMVI